MRAAPEIPTFTQPGSYLLELSADDGVHAIARDAVVISVMPPVRMANISTRAAIGVGENVSIGGFIVQEPAERSAHSRAWTFAREVWCERRAV